MLVNIQFLGVKMKFLKSLLSRIKSKISHWTNSATPEPIPVESEAVSKSLLKAPVETKERDLSSLYRAMDSGSNLIKETGDEIQAFESKVLAMVQKGDDIDLGLQTLQMRSNDVQGSYKEMSGNILALSETREKLEEIQSIIDEVLENSKKISQIAFKAQLLSFNASIEAARAGAAGRGFSVVAQEVGVLAQMSQSTAAEISENLLNNKNTIDAIVTQVSGNIDRTKELEGTVSDYFVNLVNMMDEVKVQSNAIKEEGGALESDLSGFATDLTGSLGKQLENISDSISELSGLKIHDLSPDELNNNLSEYHLIDIRPENAFGSDDAIAGSHRIPGGNGLTDYLMSLPKETALVFICDNGEVSKGACMKAQAKNFKNIYNLTGGMEAWNRDILNISNDIASAF